MKKRTVQVFKIKVSIERLDWVYLLIAIERFSGSRFCNVLSLIIAHHRVSFLCDVEHVTWKTFYPTWSLYLILLLWSFNLNKSNESLDQLKKLACIWFHDQKKISEHASFSLSMSIRHKTLLLFEYLIKIENSIESQTTTHRKNIFRPVRLVSLVWKLGSKTAIRNLWFQNFGVFSIFFLIASFDIFFDCDIVFWNRVQR